MPTRQTTSLHINQEGKENMPSSRAFGLSSSSASSRHANRARPASDDEQYSDDADDSYRRVKKASALPSNKSAGAHKSSAIASLASSRSKRAVDDEADYDQIRPVKKSVSAHHPAHKSSSSKSRNHHNEDDGDRSGSEYDEPASGLTDELFMERKAFDDWVEKKLSKLTSKREQMLEERLDRLRSERDEIQSQYDELRQLRQTAPEQALDEYKKVAEARYRHDKDLINSLKVKVEAAEKRVKEAENGGAAGGAADRSISILNASVVRGESVQPESPDHRIEELEKQHRREMAEATRQQKRLEEDVRTYKLQLEQEIAQSKALLRAASSAAASASAAAAASSSSVSSGANRVGGAKSSNVEPSAVSTSLAAMEDEKAVRKLYEDLTGLVITGVERIDPNQAFRRFKAIFAQEDYYSILMDLEESSSKLSSSSSSSTAANNAGKMRDDIVYVPKLDDDRDSELLSSQMVPQEWLDALRFDRQMLFKWYEKTRKALLTDEARRKIRAREERSGSGRH